MRIDPNRPMEEMVGVNEGVLRMKLGRIHCGTPFREACKQVLKKRLFRRLRKQPVAFRRGFFKCAYEIWKRNRDEWRQFS